MLVKLTLPVGAMGVGEVSVTVAVQVVGEPVVTEEGTQSTEVDTG